VDVEVRIIVEMISNTVRSGEIFFISHLTLMGLPVNSISFLTSKFIYTKVVGIFCFFFNIGVSDVSEVNLIPSAISLFNAASIFMQIQIISTSNTYRMIILKDT